MVILNSKASHLFMGLTLNIFHLLLWAIVGPLFLSAQHLTRAQTYLLSFCGEVLAFLPCLPVVRRNWNVKSSKEWAALLGVSVTISSQIIPYIYCSRVLPLGDVAALEVSGVIAAPFVGALLYRRCVKVTDCACVTLAIGGVVLITKPTFLFHGAAGQDASGLSTAAVPLAHFFAVLLGVSGMFVLFVLGFFSHVHWSCYLLIRTMCTGLVSVTYFVAARDWSFSPDVTVVTYLTALGTGPLFNLVRITSIYRCQELEAFSPGLTGILGNVMYTAVIPLTCLYSWAFFGQVPGVSEALGSALIIFAVVLLTLGKYLQQRKQKKNLETKDGVETQELIKRDDVEAEELIKEPQ